MKEARKGGYFPPANGSDVDLHILIYTRQSTVRMVANYRTGFMKGSALQDASYLVEGSVLKNIKHRHSRHVIL